MLSKTEKARKVGRRRWERRDNLNDSETRAKTLRKREKARVGRRRTGRKRKD